MTSSEHDREYSNDLDQESVDAALVVGGAAAGDQPGAFRDRGRFKAFFDSRRRGPRPRGRDRRPGEDLEGRQRQHDARSTAANNGDFAGKAGRRRFVAKVKQHGSGDSIEHRVRLPCG